MPKSTIKIARLEELQWPFRAGLPQYKFDKWGTANCDPFPCYTHDLNIATDCIKDIEKIWPPETPITWHLAEFEDEGRTNAFSQKCEHYDDEEEFPWNAHVFLSGKRTPINPAMTENLVAHEYGHHVDYWLAHRLYPEIEKGYQRDYKFQQDYAEIRGCEYNKAYGARNWHTAIGEIIANDFRILVANVQEEFWPHPVEHPHNVKSIMKFWEDQLRARHSS